MKVALLTDSIEAGSPGFSGYVRNLADALLASHAHDVTLVHRGAHPWYEGRRHETPTNVGTFPLLRQLRLPPYLQAGGYDLVHDTYHFGPFLRPAPYARVLTLGDLTPLVTDTHSRKQRWSHRLLAPLIAHRAHHICTFSESSKRDIVRLFHVPPKRITVTYLAASNAFRPLPPANIAEARRRLTLPDRYFLHVGTIEPRKNIDRLLRAYASALPHLEDARLLLVGRRGWRMEHLPALVRHLGIEDRVIIRDDIANDDLPAVYGGALALAYPSQYEGFGLPPLEAMQCGIPVLTSTASSLPEVVGDAAVSVDPGSISEIARSLVDLVSDDALRSRLAAAGIERARLFSWQRCADATLAAWELAAHAARIATAGAEMRAAA